VAALIGNQWIMLSLNDVVVTKSDALSAEIDGSLILLSVERGTYCGLDDIGTAIWHQMAAPIEIGTLCRRLVEEYLGAPEEIERDLLQLLDTLEDQSLIEVRRL
jgi:hypothetical protein